MRPLIVLAIAAMCLCFLPIAHAQQVPCVQNPDGSISCPAATAEVASPEASEEAVGRLGILERRKLGLTFRNVLRAAKELDAAGQFDAENPDLTSARLAVKLAAENPKAYQEVGVDWDAILAFIEALLPLIIQFMTIFGGL